MSTSFVCLVTTSWSNIMTQNPGNVCTGFQMNLVECLGPALLQRFFLFSNFCIVWVRICRLKEIAPQSNTLTKQQKSRLGAIVWVYQQISKQKVTFLSRFFITHWASRSYIKFKGKPFNQPIRRRKMKLCWLVERIMAKHYRGRWFVTSKILFHPLCGLEGRRFRCL